MKSIQALREARAEKIKAMKSLQEQFGQSRWTPDQQKQWDALVDEVNGFDDEIKRVQQMLDLEAEAAVDPTRTDAGSGKKTRSEAAQLFDRWMRGGDKAVSAEDWQRIRNTMSTTTDSEGGYTVPDEISGTIIEAVKAYGGMRDVAMVIRTGDGRQMNWPTSDGTAEEGEIVAQNTAASDLDVSFGTVAMDAFKYSSKVVTVPWELLQDSASDIEGLIRDRLAMRLGRVTNKHFTIGAGTTEPFGIVTRATSGKVGTTGQTTSVIYDDLVDLQHSVDPAYRETGNTRFMLNDSTLKVIRKIKDSAGRPIFVPSYDAGIVQGVPGTILGDPYKINQHMPVMAANAKSILYGDLSKYIIRDVMQLTLFRFDDSPYAKKGQVGFLAWMRSSGNLIDTAAVKYYANSAT